MNTDALGPCPLCGGEARLVWMNDHHGDAFDLGCLDPQCKMTRFYYTEEPEMEEEAVEKWQKLSALAAQNKRRGEALESVGLWIKSDDCRGVWKVAAMKMCEEALK